MEKNLIKKIKGLKEIQPSSEWMNSTRNKLINQIGLDEKADFMGFGFFQWLKNPQSFALVFSLMFMVLCGPWLAIEASKASLPGELLYSVKKMAEGVQTTITSENSRSQLSVEFAGRRLEELGKISEDSQDSQDNKKIDQVVSEIKDNLAEASFYANRISEENIIAVIKKANKIKDKLSENKEIMSSEAQIELIEAEKSIEQINRQILASLIRDKDSEDGLTTTTDQEILIFLKELEDGSVTTTDQVINEE